MGRFARFSVPLLLLALHAGATTFVVPSDRHLIQDAGAIVTARVVTSFTQLTETGAIETVTTIEVGEVLKGRPGGPTLAIHEPGGRYGDLFETAAGVPQFRDGEEVLLFLMPAGSDRWTVYNLALGKFSLARTGDGTRVAVRDEEVLHGWTAGGAPHHERRRNAAKFTAYIRAVAAGEEADAEAYLLPAGAGAEDEVLTPVSQSHSTYTPQSYLLTPGYRWNTWQQTFTRSNDLAGAEEGGRFFISVAIGLWAGDAGSFVNFSGGLLDATKTAGALGAADGANTVNWERNLSSMGVPAYSCQNGGIFGFTKVRANGTHTGPDGVSFGTIVEADVDMNQGIAGCEVFNISNLLYRAVAHEIGHALGFRHADRNEDNTAPCAGDKECVPAKPTPPTPDDGPNAIMRSVLATNMAGTLQQWDINAVRAVYPQTQTDPPAEPTGVTATATSSTSVTVTWTPPARAMWYRVYRGTSPLALTAIAEGFSTPAYVDTTVAPSTAYEYRVQALNDAGVSDFNDRDFTHTSPWSQPTLLGATAMAADLNELREAVNDLRAMTGSLGPFDFSAPVPAPGSPIVSSHLHELLVYLNEVRSSYAKSLLAFGETVAPGTTVKAAHQMVIRNGAL